MNTTKHIDLQTILNLMHSLAQVLDDLQEMLGLDAEEDTTPRVEHRCLDCDAERERIAALWDVEVMDKF